MRKTRSEEKQSEILTLSSPSPNSSRQMGSFLSPFTWPKRLLELDVLYYSAFDILDVYRESAYPPWAKNQVLNLNYIVALVGTFNFEVNQGFSYGFRMMYICNKSDINEMAIIAKIGPDCGLLIKSQSVHITVCWWYIT
jgi:hypothetical protein